MVENKRMMMMISPILLITCTTIDQIGLHTVLSTLLHSRQDPPILTKRVTQGKDCLVKGLWPNSVKLRPSIPTDKLLTKPRLSCRAGLIVPQLPPTPDFWKGGLCLKFSTCITSHPCGSKDLHCWKCVIKLRLLPVQITPSGKSLTIIFLGSSVLQWVNNSTIKITLHCFSLYVELTHSQCQNESCP